MKSRIPLIDICVRQKYSRAWALSTIFKNTPRRIVPYETCENLEYAVARPTSNAGKQKTNCSVRRNFNTSNFYTDANHQPSDSSRNEGQKDIIVGKNYMPFTSKDETNPLDTDLDKSMPIWDDDLDLDEISEFCDTLEIRQEREQENVECTKEYTRVNEINMQMLSKPLHEQVFKNAKTEKVVSPEEIETIKKNLKAYGIDVADATRFPDVNLKLPPLQGNDIEEHFYNIANQQVSPYLKIINSIITDIPERPKTWLFREGWTRYTADGAEPVDYPLEDGLVFDVEVCMKEGPLPTIATAVSKDAWYSWVSKSLVDDSGKTFEGKSFTQDMLIPMESKSTEYGQKLNAYQRKPKIIVGHNVSFDRSKIKEQYWLNCTGTRFIDTMSLHISISGVNSYQRNALNSKKTNFKTENWAAFTSLNSLAEVHKLYCGTKLNKAPRNIFVEGTLADIKKNFHSLMTYCASDVIATHNVLSSIFPIFLERFPHPVTLAGILELGIAYLPVNSNWQRYLEEAESTYEDLNNEAKVTLAKRADAVCRLMHDEKYKEDLWMWDEDWSTQKLKIKSSKVKTTVSRCQKKKVKEETEEANVQKCLTEDEDEEDPLEKEFAYLKETKKLLYKSSPHMPGYPAWYRKLCMRNTAEDWAPGPQNISSSMQIVPKLLNLTWENYPLHFIKGKGWGILVPYTDNPYVETKVPLQNLIAQCPLQESIRIDDQDRFKYDKDKRMASHFYKGTAVWCDTNVDHCCYFFKLPHKNGENYNVGNPLAKDFVNKFSDNVLAGLHASAAEMLKIPRMVSYWRNNRDRIMSQFIIWFENHYFPSGAKRSKKKMRYGGIIPHVIVSGTLTRRAVESTWMTASNAHEERVGSELRSMIQAPPGYNIVGADVDSQELWIASIIGDAHYKKIHGATPFGWMTLIGSKSNGTDMHSVTARAAGISRDHAKIINYARIYGAGQIFAQGLLKQFNPSITDMEAQKKAQKMFSITKGKKVYTLKREYVNADLIDTEYTSSQAKKIAVLHRQRVSEMFERSMWTGGSESAMFNRLEEIAESPHPITPFLNSRLTRALESNNDTMNYLPTKINWVVQSGAVDFLHLMLVSMRWLMRDNARFCLSFHDEIRYLVPAQYKYNAALSMHATNLLTRAFCASRLGMMDLPMSVAFFASVEVDTVLRKESSHDCKTPSNPHGLKSGYEIPLGESLDIHAALQKSEGSLGSWHNVKNDKHKTNNN